ncbi:uncharacterized protein VDAG_02415 [Verticillium dahliae VdLs.17]|uniref:BZIP domain-containing protein n=1 Tax=Verticillium dahliae (strain VdLs.17 / ATCC MYA-4575 / FGSC 10137) TaxID=498257 RepID=G2WXT3_VERDV|nr:uncharacterized protein VDAG_02415 [Verticillium dahliae VdLs.17]EGY20891.1 hypothetical protein VDAG_02415 [Verticillium dahliae VdLs.17]
MCRTTTGCAAGFEHGPTWRHGVEGVQDLNGTPWHVVDNQGQVQDDPRQNFSHWSCPRLPDTPEASHSNYNEAITSDPPFYLDQPSMVDYWGGGALLLGQSAAPMPSSARNDKDRILPEAEADASNTTSRGASASDYFVNLAFRGASTVAYGPSHETQHQPSQSHSSSIQPKHRGRPPKGWPAQNRETIPRTVAPRSLFDRYPPNFSVNLPPPPQTDNPASGSDKKMRLRARNRVAAHKSRARKQHGIEDLQAQESNVGAVNKDLKHQYAKLRGEVLVLKDMVLQHGGCGCPFIESYIKDTAVSLSQKPNAITATGHGSSSTAILAAASSSPVTPQGQGACGSPLFHVESDNGLCFDSNMMWSGMDLCYDGGQMEGTSNRNSYGLC